jgi:hypothetical protein
LIFGCHYVHILQEKSLPSTPKQLSVAKALKAARQAEFNRLSVGQQTSELASHLLNGSNLPPAPVARMCQEITLNSLLENIPIQFLKKSFTL